MAKRFVLLVVALSLSAGTAQADAMDAQDGHPYPAMSQSTPPELARTPGATKPAQRMAAQEAARERTPAVAPPNPDCGQYGGE